MLTSRAIFLSINLQMLSSHSMFKFRFRLPLRVFNFPRTNKGLPITRKLINQSSYRGRYEIADSLSSFDPYAFVGFFLHMFKFMSSQQGKPNERFVICCAISPPSLHSYTQQVNESFAFLRLPFQ